jgi:hypothetical protein
MADARVGFRWEIWGDRERERRSMRNEDLGTGREWRLGQSPESLRDYVRVGQSPESLRLGQSPECWVAEKWAFRALT